MTPPDAISAMLREILRAVQEAEQHMPPPVHLGPCWFSLGLDGEHDYQDRNCLRCHLKRFEEIAMDLDSEQLWELAKRHLTPPG